MRYRRHGTYSDIIQRINGGREFQFQIIDNVTVAIPLTRGLQTFIDIEDAERISAHNWCALKVDANFYAVRKGKATILLHHEVLLIDAKDLNGLEVDHRDRNSLNNRKQNLCVVTRQINSLNSERSDNKIGVTFDRAINRGRAAIYIPEERRRKYLGVAETKEEALRMVELWKRSQI